MANAEYVERRLFLNELHSKNLFFTTK